VLAENSRGQSWLEQANRSLGRLLFSISPSRSPCRNAKSDFGLLSRKISVENAGGDVPTCRRGCSGRPATACRLTQLFDAHLVVTEERF
jgi:hypothetical protein